MWCARESSTVEEVGLKVLVTGSNGFVGQHLCELLTRSGFDVVRAVRNPAPGAVAVGSISGDTDWSEALRGVDAVVHAAARVHMLNDASVDPMTEFQKVNVEGTLNLAQQAAHRGVSRFIFLSSIAVHGLTSEDQPFSPFDKPNPHDAYGYSKFEAEKGLIRISSETGMEQVIIRPPLVYGPGVGANFLRLMKLAASGLPLPLGGIRNLRSPVFVGNLCDLVQTCLEHPAAANRIFLVSDNRDVSTPDLLRTLAGQMGCPIRLFRVPAFLLRLAGLLTGRSGEIARVCGSLQLDISQTKEVLGWRPPFTMDAGIELTVKDYLKSTGRKNKGCS
jgi:UDP-glucose 4-epimerase